MIRALRLLFFLACLGLMAYGLTIERHEVRSLGVGEPRVLNGPRFVEGTTTDDFMRRDEWLYDVRSLVPYSTSIKDCKT